MQSFGSQMQVSSTECRRHLTMSNMINFLASTTALSTFTTQLLPVTGVLIIR